MKKRQLERALEAVPDFPDPDPAREQYRTPSAVAADLLWAAWTDGAIAGKRVLDLGCGTGVFSLGALLLGARSVAGVDADLAAVAVARSAVPKARFEVAELANWRASVADTVVMNPPFGAQRRGADRVFYERARDAVAAQHGTCWFLAQPRTERFLAAYAGELGATLERVGTWSYPIEARFPFHDQPVRRIEVGGYRMAWD